MAELFSAYAEVFPSLTANSSIRAAFLCLRRGVSHRQPGVRTSEDFSLPTQRCFQAEEMEKAAPELFSAYAEVFLSDPLPAPEFKPFLCLRRGVSRTRLVDDRRRRLFSAYAEVFLCLLRLMRSFPSFLCLRRGVSA